MYSIDICRARAAWSLSNTTQSAGGARSIVKYLCHAVKLEKKKTRRRRKKKKEEEDKK